MADGEDAKSLGQYLVELGQNADLREAHLRNAERAMREAGVSTADRDLLLEGDLEQIQAAIATEFGEAAIIVYLFVPPKVY